MKLGLSNLAISNLAWNLDEELQILEILKEQGVCGIELAPTKFWPDLSIVKEGEARALRERYAASGITICALQSLLFGRNDLVLFGSATALAETKALLKKVISIAGWLGATALVFGSPKNRSRGALSSDEALKIAVPFFRELGEHAAMCGTSLCIEPNPAAYGADFILTSSEGARLVSAVNSGGFGLHLDSAGMHLSGEDAPQSIMQHAQYLRHFHISAPQLAAVDESSPIKYGELLRALESVKYTGWVSIEMKQLSEGGNARAVKTALQFLKRYLSS